MNRGGVFYNRDRTQFGGRFLRVFKTEQYVERWGVWQTSPKYEAINSVQTDRTCVLTQTIRPIVSCTCVRSSRPSGSGDSDVVEESFIRDTKWGPLDLILDRSPWVGP